MNSNLTFLERMALAKGYYDQGLSLQCVANVVQCTTDELQALIEDAQIVEMYKRGDTMVKIADALKVPNDNVRTTLEKYGIIPKPKSQKKIMHKSKAISDDVKKAILKEYADGVKPAEIGKKYGYATGTIYNFANRAGVRKGKTYGEGKKPPNFSPYESRCAQCVHIFDNTGYKCPWKEIVKAQYMDWTCRVPYTEHKLWPECLKIWSKYDIKKSNSTTMLADYKVQVIECKRFEKDTFCEDVRKRNGNE